MKNRGFTLIELLGVIIILSLLVLIVLPNVINSTKNSTKKTDDLTLKMIYDASDMYISNHSDDFPENDGNKFSIELSELVAEGLLVSPIKYGKDNDITNKKCVQVTYNNGGFNYELKNTGECKNFFDPICILKEGESQTIGSKYICTLDEERTFYVLENIESSDDISLIMDQNIGNLVAWCKDTTLCKTNGNFDNTKGPITAKAYLASQTSDWGVTVSLPTEEQIKGAYTESMPTWLYDYLKDTPHPLSNLYGYWTASKYDGNPIRAWTVFYNGSMRGDDIQSEWGFGVRPVITISKSRLD